MQLQNAKLRFEGQGIKLAAISYDSPAILKDFADRHKIEFPLLADPDSSLIRSFNVLNAEANGMTKGMARPGFFYIDSEGVIRDTYFEVKYTDRFTPNNVIGKLFPELAEEVSQNVEAPHLRLTLAQSDRTVAPGSRVTLTAEIELPPGVHVYSPGVTGYKPIQLVLDKSGGIETAPVTYPSSKILYLEAIKEQVSGRPSGVLGGEDGFDCRRVAVSSLRQDDLLSANVSASKMGVKGSTPRPPPISRKHSAQVATGTTRWHGLQAGILNCFARRKPQVGEMTTSPSGFRQNSKSSEN